MTIAASQLDSFAELAKAIGLLTDSGAPNAAWFADPVGKADGSVHGLRTVLSDDAQRNSLVAFVDDVLGPPGRARRDDEVWVPLFRETTPNVTIYAVLKEVPGAVRLGIGLEHDTAAAAPSVATRIHVPIFQMARTSGTKPVGAPGLPDWLLLGVPGGRIEVSVDATLSDTPPPPGAASLGGASVSLAIPTATDDQLEVSIELRDLQLPGATSPKTFRLDASKLDDLGAEVFSLVTGLVRAQADALDLTKPALRPFAALTGVLGLRDVPGLPPLPLADLPTRGVHVVVDWIASILIDNTARDLWLGQLALLTGATVDAARDAVTFAVGPLHADAGVRVTAGTGGHPVLVPWCEVGYETRAGVQIRFDADICRVDTATGAISALPALSATAVFGADAGGGVLLAGDPKIGSVHVGVTLGPTRRPAFLLTLADVDVGGRPYDVLDLSSPTAALDAASSVIDGALTTALAGLGEAGTLVAKLVGLDPPGGVGALAATELLADPLAAVGRYWHDLLTTPVAMAEVLGAVRRVVSGTALGSVPGAGTALDPWAVDLVGPFGLRVMNLGGSLVIDLAATVTTPVFADDEVAATFAVTVLRADLIAKHVEFASAASGSLILRRVDRTTSSLVVGPIVLDVDAVGIDVRWTPTRGLRAAISADGLEVVLPPAVGPATIDAPMSVALPVPTFDASGDVVFAPDWDAIEPALAALLSRVGVPIVDLLIELIGWTGRGARLRLGSLIGGGAEGAIEAWLADLILDCGHVETALGPIAALLSGFSLHAPLGVGSERDPFRCPVAGEPRAPALVAWLEPGCPPGPDAAAPARGRLPLDPPPEMATLVAAIADNAVRLPDVADLLVGRDSLADGLTLLLDRWTGTDGLVGAPVAMPDGVMSVVVPDCSYDELVALGSIGALIGEALDPEPTAVVHVGCEESFVVDRAAGTFFDTTGTVVVGTIPAAGDGAWFVRLPTPSLSAVARPDRGGIGEQATRLAAVLASRTDPIVVVGYGAAGAAVVRAAATVATVTDVITVGTPWAGLAVDSLATGLGGDALRFLDRLRRPNPDRWPEPLLALEATPLQQLRLLVERATAVVSSTTAPAVAIPSADTEIRRAGLRVAAVFGSLGRDQLSVAVATLVADGLAARSEAPAAAVAPADVVQTALHLGVDVPVFDLDLGGLLVGVGATVELAALKRGVAAGSIAPSALRGVTVNVHIGVHDGWLVGGPGASQRDVDVRWMSARVVVPLDGRPGDAELVLHEARTFDVFRERWVVRADGVGGTTALPEIKIILGEVVARVRAASPELGQLLDLLGVGRLGGLDPEGIDRLLFDTAAMAKAAFAAAPSDLAAAIRALVPSATGTGSTLAWSAGPGALTFDLAAGSVGIVLSSSIVGMPPMTATLTSGRSGATIVAAIGSVDASLGGLRLVARAGGTNDLAFEWAKPGAAVARRIGLLPKADGEGLLGMAAVAVPVVLAHAVGSHARSVVSAAARPLLDGALDAVGLLGTAAANGERPLLLAMAAFDDPAAWLRHGIASWRTDLVTSALSLLDALAPIMAPARGVKAGWPIVEGLTISYRADDGALRLVAELTVDTVLDGRTVETRLAAGLAIGSNGAPVAALDASVSIDGHGVHTTIAPHLHVELLRPSPATPLPLYPNGPGLGSVVKTAGEMVIPIALNALIAHRTDAGPSLGKDVAQAVFDLGGALDLLEASLFTGDRINTFAADPAARLAARLPVIAATGIAALGRALDTGGTMVAVTGPTAGVVKLAFGPGRKVSVTIDGAGPIPSIVIAADLHVDGIGHLVVESLRLSSDGVQVSARVGPAQIDLGALVLRPMVVVRAGVTSSTFTRLVGVGLAFDDDASTSVEFRWTLDAAAPSVVVVTRPGGVEVVDTDAADVAARLLTLAASLASGVLVERLGGVLTANAIAALQGVVFTDVGGSVAIDPAVFLDLLDAPALLLRLERLLWNLATTVNLAITIDGAVTIGLVAEDAGGGRKRLGVSLTLAPGKHYVISPGEPQVELVIDPSWIDPLPAGGLSIFALEGSVVGAVASFDMAPGVRVAGVGLRFTKTTGALLELGGVSLDAIAVHVYGEASGVGVGGGVNIELDGLAFSPGGGGGTNAVGNSIMNDAGKSGPSNRPVFSPSLAIQKHPGPGDASVSLRAGPPPGPWWIVVQRQLGPLYVERVGFDSVGVNGKVSRISLLFDGKVSLFGLTAAVDQLSLTWTVGDVLDISNWQVDLQGLAVSADMAGVSLSGGLLKTTSPDGEISYVGMLMGRFAVYGLSVFGGYSDDHGSPSFFIFGALNGPIGGPPAFFLTGIGGGLGINRGLKVPDDLSRFNEYPFIKALDPAAKPSSDPMAELRSLNAYFPPERGTFWFAAGISFTSFALVDGVAVVAVAFGDGLEINLFGLARMALPRPEVALVSIELGLVARFSTREGLFSIRAQLTDNSWLLYSDVRLTGGFAFVVWWKGTNTGQFVLTIGGYHPSFHRDGYPEVPRLGLMWRVSDDIVVKGGSYFALTSEALMAGVDVEVSADFGWAWARVAFGAHGIVYFDPFWFEVSAYARISAGVKIHTFFGTISFSISLGARVRVWGPDFSGEATFEVGPCDLSVGFGSERTVEAQTLEWPAFVTKYLEDAGGGKARALSSIAGRGTLPAATGGKTGAPSSDGSSERPFEVFAEFELIVVTTVPTSRVDLGLVAGPLDIPISRSDGAPGVLGLSPMRASALASTLRMALEKQNPVTMAYAPIPAQLQVLGANLAAPQPRAEGSLVGTDAFPIGAWGAPPPDTKDKALPKGDVLFAGNSLKLVAEVAKLAVGPEINYYRVESSRRPLPLQATGTDRAKFLQSAKAFVPAAITTAQEALDVARDRMFLADTASPPDGLLPRGLHSNLARATFDGDRAAPPLFGTLTDGLAKANAADGTFEKQVPPVGVGFLGHRVPVVTGYLTVGTAFAERPAVTTVADTSIARRAAPTSEAAHARLGLRLPATLLLAATPATSTASGTVVAHLATPRTDATGATSSYLGARVGAIGLGGLVGGLGGPALTGSRTSAAAGQRVIGPGELVVMVAPDSSVDSDATSGRPRLSIKGSARVTMLRGDSTVLVDATVGGQAVSVPPGTAMMAVQAGGTTSVTDGLAGWHDGSHLCALGSHSALGAGCVLVVDTGGAGAGTGWAKAADIVAGASSVTTRFSAPVRTVVISITGAEPDRLDSIGLELIGATRALGADGSPSAPTVVLSGQRATLVYGIDPTAATDAVSVRVRSGGDWQLVAMLGGDGDVSSVARLVAERGLVNIAGRVLATARDACAISWTPPSPLTGKKAPAAKKAPAKKAPAKKAPAKKVAAKKSATSPRRPKR